MLLHYRNGKASTGWDRSCRAHLARCQTKRGVKVNSSFVSFPCTNPAPGTEFLYSTCFFFANTFHFTNYLLVKLFSAHLVGPILSHVSHSKPAAGPHAASKCGFPLVQASTKGFVVPTGFTTLPDFGSDTLTFWPS